MEKGSVSNTSGENVAKMTLQDYYSSLPEATCPKTEFLNKAAEKCGVSLSTVRNWIKFGMKPSNPNHMEVMAELTGIDASELWKG